MKTIDLDVQGMICGACIQRVKAALAPIDGVRDVEVDLSAGRVRVTAAANVAPSRLIAALGARRYDSTLAIDDAPLLQAAGLSLSPAARKGGCGG